MIKNKTPPARKVKLPDPENEALVESERRYRRLFETARDGILILDAETGIVVDVNPFLLDLLNYPYERFVGKAIWELGFFKDIVGNRDNFAELQQQEYIRYEDKPLESADGTRHEVEFISNVYLVESSKVIQCNIRDITERKREEGYRELSREILQILSGSEDIQNCIQKVLTVLKQSTAVNAAGIRLQDGDDFPYFVQEGFSEDFLQTENSLTVRNADGGVCRDGSGAVSLECTCGLVLCSKTDPSNALFTPGGSFWTNDSMPLLDIPDGEDPRLHPRNECIHQGYASVALIPIRTKDRNVGLIQLNARQKGHFTLKTIELLEDIASHIGEAMMRKRAEEALRASQQLLEGILNAIPVRVFWKDKNLVYLGCNAAFARDAGFADPKEVIGKDDFQMSWHGQADLYRADDRRIIESGESTSNREEAQTTPGGDTITLLTSEVPLRNLNGEINGILGTYVDITEQRSLEAQLRQAQKMEAVGRLAGGVAHDFNNMLQVILGYTGIALEQAEPSRPLYTHLKEIQKAAERSAGLTRQLLAFARKQDIEPKILDLNDAVSGMLKMLRRLIGENIHLTWVPGSDLRPVKIDPSQIDQILANLCLNARDSVIGSGTVILETGNVTIDAAYCAKHAEAVPGGYVFLSVSDDGCGMDAETMAHIFEPFFTTKGVGEGTGLGLATVYGIVKQNGGFVYAYSEPGIGTTFRIYLPQSAAEAVQSDVTAVKTPEARGETVLLVEDEPSLRTVYKLFLDALGYTVLSAETPEEAFKLSQRHSGQIHLLLTDVVMPGMNGRQLADRICATKPDINVLFMSGCTADVMIRRGVLEQDKAFIAKPFSQNELARKVRAVLDTKEPA
jgi:PAS domain S-box-containing protein